MPRGRTSSKLGVVLDQPATVAEALVAGVNWRQLQSRRWRRLARGTYAPSGAPQTPRMLLAAIWRRMPEGAAFSGPTAGWLHGLDLPPCDPVDVTVPAEHVVSQRAGVRFHKARLHPSEVVMRQGFQVTSVLRTTFDLGAARDLTDAVIALDMGLQAGLIDAGDLVALSASHGGRKGVARFRRAATLADIAESPMETRLRLLLVIAGLPRPEPQVELFDELGQFIARVDLYYASHRLCIEFDGGHHRDTLVEDNRRQNRLVEAGFTLIRFTSYDVFGTPDRVVATVRAALARPESGDFPGNRPVRGLRVGDFPGNAEGRRWHAR